MLFTRMTRESHVELAVSFMKFACCYLPVKRAKQDGILHLFLPATASEAQANNVVLSELGLMMSYLLRQMEQLVSPSVMPVNPVVACKGLYRLGARNQSKGYMKRPCLPAQNDTMESLAILTRVHGQNLPSQVIDIPVEAPIDLMRSELRDSWALRVDRVKRTVQQVRILSR